MCSDAYLPAWRACPPHRRVYLLGVSPGRPPPREANFTNREACLEHAENLSKKVHFDSIEPNYIDIFKNKDVLLIDDVVTSGNSLDACSEILKKPFDIEEGAKSVVKFAIWKTIQ